MVPAQSLGALQGRSLADPSSRLHRQPQESVRVSLQLLILWPLLWETGSRFPWEPLPANAQVTSAGFPPLT